MLWLPDTACFTRLEGTAYFTHQEDTTYFTRLQPMAMPTDSNSWLYFVGTIFVLIIITIKFCTSSRPFQIDLLFLGLPSQKCWVGRSVWKRKYIWILLELHVSCTWKLQRSVGRCCVTSSQQYHPKRNHNKPARVVCILYIVIQYNSYKLIVTHFYYRYQQSQSSTFRSLLVFNGIDNRSRNVDGCDR